MNTKDLKALIANGTRKFQFGKDRRSISIYEITDSTVKFFDGHRDPIQAKLFELTIDEFTNYLSENNARTHWTVGA
jgi:hypothetical protein